MCLRQVSYTQRLSALQLKSFNPASHGLAETKLQKCLLGVQTSHLLLMASNRNSICDIWSHKTINSDREIVNSTSRCFSFSDVDLISAPILATCLNWAQLGSLQRFAISSTRWGRLLRDGNENINPPEFTDRKGNGIAKKSTFEWQTSVTKIQVYKSVNNFMWYFFDTTGKRFFESRDIYFFVWKYWSISGLVRKPLTVGQTLRAASGSSFLWKKNKKTSHLKNFQNIRIAIWS